jgi:SAM-dependent methyltransferase
MWNSEYIMQCYRTYREGEVDTTISPNETMHNQWYFQVGRSAADNIALAVLASHLTEVRHVLDLPCGHGRVLRHLVKLFPSAEFDACDLDLDGIRFCADTFGARAIHSKEELTSVVFDKLYDVIWVGSLFTHTSHDRTRRWLPFLTRYLSRNGVLVATVHGRWSEHVHKVAPYIGTAAWQAIIDGYRECGYGYADYQKSDSHDFIGGSYGVSLAKPHVIVRDVEEIDSVRLLLYRERAWADHQDVLVIGRPAFNEPWPNRG